MEVSDITNSMKSYPIPWVCGFLSLLLGVYLYITLSSLPELEAKLSDLESEILVFRSNRNAGRTLEADLESLNELFDTVDDRLIDRNQLANNTGYFYSLAQEHPVEVLNVSQKSVISESEKKKPSSIWALKHFCVVPIEMEVVGYLTDVLDFLYILDASDRFVQVQSFSMSIANNREPGFVNLSLTVQVLGSPMEKKKK